MSPIRPKKEPKQSRSKETVDAILQSVVVLIDRREPESITTTKIAERAGISIGSLYQYFPAKEAIFSAVIEWYLKKEAELILSALGAQEGKPLEAAVDEMLAEIIAIRTRNLKLEQTLLGYFAGAGDFEFLKRYDERMIAELDKALDVAEGRGFLRKNSTTAFLLLHVIRSTFFAATVERPQIYKSPDELRGALKKIVMALLSPEPAS